MIKRKIRSLASSLQNLTFCESYFTQEENLKKEKICKGAIYFLKAFKLDKDRLILNTGQRVRISKIRFSHTKNLKDFDTSYNGVNFKVLNTPSGVCIQYFYELMSLDSNGLQSVEVSKKDYNFNPEYLLSNGLPNILKEYTASEIEQIAIFGIKPSKKELDRKEKRMAIRSLMESNKKLLHKIKEYASYERNKDKLFNIVSSSYNVNGEELKKSIKDFESSLNLYTRY